MAYKKPTKYKVKKPEKYVGNADNVWIRSNWEKQFFIQCESRDDIVQWGSEVVVIPYRDPHKRGKIRRYFTDVWMKNSKGEIFVVEIKPFHQTQKPVRKRGKRKKTFLNEAKTYDINQAKWKSAKSYCEKRGWKFMIVTEKQMNFSS